MLFRSWIRSKDGDAQRTGRCRYETDGYRLYQRSWYLYPTRRHIGAESHKKSVRKHLELDEIKEVMKEYKDSYNMYRKLLVISMVYQGETISQASNYVHASRKSGERWVKNYNENGLEGLYSNYHNCGRKPKLTNEQLVELKEIITSSEESYTIDDVQKLIKELYGVNHDYKTVWTIVRKKLGLNYGKPFIKYSSRPKDAEEHLKKT